MIPRCKDCKYYRFEHETGIEYCNDPDKCPYLEDEFEWEGEDE